MTAQPEPFVIPSAHGGEERHERGNPDCGACSYPAARVCPACGGVVHFFDYDEGWDEESGEEWQTWRSRCDGCGKTWFELSDEWP